MALLLFSYLQSKAQIDQLQKIEKDIKANAMEHKFDKAIIDLNNDQIDDYIYLYQCGEPKCIKVYLNINGVLKEQITEQCWNYQLFNINNRKILTLTLGHCCGESPYVSIRSFEFNTTRALIKDNYVLTNTAYTGASRLSPPFYNNQPEPAVININNYNLRFSPDTDLLKGDEKATFPFGITEGTNIIAQIKMGSKINILSDSFSGTDPGYLSKWIPTFLVGKDHPVSFDFKDQQLRGWISSKYVTRK
jgi:hypothetical protein